MLPLFYEEWGDLLNVRLVNPSSQPLVTTGSAGRAGERPVLTRCGALNVGLVSKMVFLSRLYHVFQYLLRFHLLF